MALWKKCSRRHKQKNIVRATISTTAVTIRDDTQHNDEFPDDDYDTTATTPPPPPTAANSTTTTTTTTTTTRRQGRARQRTRYGDRKPSNGWLSVAMQTNRKQHFQTSKLPNFPNFQTLPHQ